MSLAEIAEAQRERIKKMHESVAHFMWRQIHAPVCSIGRRRSDFYALWRQAVAEIEGRARFP